MIPVHCIFGEKEDVVLVIHSPSQSSISLT